MPGMATPAETLARRMPLMQVSMHLQITGMLGTARHLLEDHQLPPELLDADDTQGLHADHAWIHGYRIVDVGGGYTKLERRAVEDAAALRLGR